MHSLERRLMTSSFIRRASTSKRLILSASLHGRLADLGLLHSGDQEAAAFHLLTRRPSVNLRNGVMTSCCYSIIHYLAPTSLFLLLPLHSRSHTQRPQILYSPFASSVLLFPPISCFLPHLLFNHL